MFRACWPCRLARDIWRRAKATRISRFAWGEHAWGVQFHPEFDADVMRGYLEGRRERILAEGLDADALRAAVADAPAGPRILRRFAARVRAVE